jgi:hypothetical protein
MGMLLTRALAEAGLSEIAERAMRGEGLGQPDLTKLRGADLLLVAGLADAVRERFRGDAVTLAGKAADYRDSNVERVEPSTVGGAEGLTGSEALFEIALTRLRVPAARSVGISWEYFGLELAQTALVFGADVLWGDLSTRRVMPGLEGYDARRAELQGLIERAGREPVWAEDQTMMLEQRS